jgi:phage shock protein C
MLFGVAGGMAEWMDLDPAIVRLVWALLILAGGVGLLLYIVAAIVIPEAPYGLAGTAPAPGAPGDAGTAAAQQSQWEARAARRAARRQGPGNAGVLIGAILVAIGVWFLIDRYVQFDTSWLIPAVLIVLGAVLVVGALGRRDSNPG